MWITQALFVHKTVSVDFSFSSKVDTLPKKVFAAARAQHTLTKIQPKVDEGYIVISDRWLASSLAYQGYARALGVGAVENINDFGIRNYRPDIQYFLDTPVEVCQQRINP